MESVTIFKSKSYGSRDHDSLRRHGSQFLRAESHSVGVHSSKLCGTPTDSDGDDSADDTDASANAVVATVTTPATDSNEVERQGRGCPICRTDIQMILRLF